MQTNQLLTKFFIPNIFVFLPCTFFFFHCDFQVQVPAKSDEEPPPAYEESAPTPQFAYPEAYPGAYPEASAEAVTPEFGMVSEDGSVAL